MVSQAACQSSEIFPMPVALSQTTVLLLLGSESTTTVFQSVVPMAFSKCVSDNKDPNIKIHYLLKIHGAHGTIGENLCYVFSFQRI